MLSSYNSFVSVLKCFVSLAVFEFVNCSPQCLVFALQRKILGIELFFTSLGLVTKYCYLLFILP